MLLKSYEKQLNIVFPGVFTFVPAQIKHYDGAEICIKTRYFRTKSLKKNPKGMCSLSRPHFFGPKSLHKRLKQRQFVRWFDEACLAECGEM